mgnify:CR=1 FL=1
MMNVDIVDFHNYVVDVLVCCREFRSPDIQEFLQTNYKSVRYRDAFRIHMMEGEVWLFEYGVLVCWGVSENDQQKLLNQLSPYIVEPMSERVFEQFPFSIEPGNPVRVQNDQLTLPDNSYLLRLAVSHGFAQSTKLSVFETVAQTVIADNAHLSKVLADTGRIPLSRKSLSKLRGKLFDTRSDILLNFNLLDTPEFFWDFPELEGHYLSVAKYLDMVARVELLNHKLETIHTLLDMLASEQNHKHSSFLEWIIILLIAVEIVLNLPSHF